MLLSASVLSGCAGVQQWVQNGFKLGPNHSPPAVVVAAAWDQQDDPRVINVPAQDLAWWTNFNDPVLNRLIDTAYQQNLDLKTAGARILEARAKRNIAVGNLFPQSQSAVGGYAHAQLGRNLNLPFPHTLDLWGTGFNATWELDFWGRYRRAIESADAALDATHESYGESLVMIFSEVASNYVQMRTYEQRLAYARENAVIQRKSLELAEARIEQGAGSELDFRQARSILAQTESSIPPLEAGRRLASHRICILLGMPATDLSRQYGTGSIPSAPPEVAVGIPADLLCRRPDIRRAEREVAAQCAQIGIAKADFFPRIGVWGFIGYAADDLRNLFTPQNFTAAVLPSMQWNVLNYGRIKNNVAAQDARLQAVTFQYQQVVLNAGREVEDSLVQFIQAQLQAHRLQEGVADTRRSVELVVTQFDGGITDFNRVYTTQSQLVQQQDQLASAQGSIAMSLIHVYRSLGGGWEAFFAGDGMPVLVEPADTEESVPASPSLP